MTMRFLGSRFAQGMSAARPAFGESVARRMRRSNDIRISWHFRDGPNDEQCSVIRQPLEPLDERRWQALRERSSDRLSGLDGAPLLHFESFGHATVEAVQRYGLGSLDNAKMLRELASELVGNFANDRFFQGFSERSERY